MGAKAPPPPTSIALQHARHTPGITLHLSPIAHHLTETPIITHFAPAHLQRYIPRTDTLSNPQPPETSSQHDNNDHNTPTMHRAVPQNSTVRPPKVTTQTMHLSEWIAMTPPSTTETCPAILEDKAPHRISVDYQHKSERNPCQENFEPEQTLPQHQRHLSLSNSLKPPPTSRQADDEESDFLSDPQE